MILNIKYRPLKAFLLAIEAGSFTHAADQLGVTQPSFTALIQDLERTLDLKLFERTTRSISLTSAGVDLRDRIQRPIADMEETYRSMMDLAAVRRGSIVVGALPSTALTLIPPALGRLRNEHPALQIRVVEAHNDELIAMLRTNQVEFALATMLVEVPDLEFIPLVADVFCTVFPSDHPIAQLKRVTWADLVALDLVLLSHGSSARSMFDRSVAADDNCTGLRYDVTHMTTAVLLVRQRLGIALLPKLALPALPLKGLMHKPISNASAKRMIGVIRRRDRQLSPASQVFIKQLQRSAAEL
ncbi:LysR family transcriptional regulator [Allopusillimonas ginsengisoli]|uniref:LysR family transcriptional regulator n=1 Tax=Allopusillimonas ginsengisoli TaxID=453575 RepID=UPI0039C178AA